MIWRSAIFSHPSFRGALLATLHFGSPGVQLPHWAPKKRHGKCCGLVSASVAICPSRRSAACGPEGESAPMGVKSRQLRPWRLETGQQRTNSSDLHSSNSATCFCCIILFSYLCYSDWFLNRELILILRTRRIWKILCVVIVLLRWCSKLRKISYFGGEAGDPQKVSKSPCFFGEMKLQQVPIQHTINFRLQHSLVPQILLTAFYHSRFNVNDEHRALLELLEYQVIICFREDWSLRAFAKDVCSLLVAGIVIWIASLSKLTW